MNNYIKRLLENDILENSKSFPVILVCGPRQVGKTTILNKLSNNKINYITLDDPLIRKLAKEDPALFLENNKPPLIIDEIQYATELLPYIKIQVDKARLNALQNNSDSNGLYYLTGSQMFTLMQNVSESLAGRVGIIDMYGLSYSELIGKEQNFFYQQKIDVNKERTIQDQKLRKFLKELLEVLFLLYIKIKILAQKNFIVDI